MLMIGYEEVRKVELDENALVQEICEKIVDTVNDTVWAEDCDFDTDKITYDFYKVLLAKVAEELKATIG